MLIIDYNEIIHSLMQDKTTHEDGVELINLSTEMPPAYVNLSYKGGGIAVWHLLSLMGSKF
jgi:hypothetical protein